jgi:hypothetical protein
MIVSKLYVKILVLLRLGSNFTALPKRSMVFLMKIPITLMRQVL